MESKLISRWKNATPQEQRHFAQEGLILAVSEEILEALDQANMSKAELARELGTSKSHISQCLTGARNMTLRTLADIAWALNRCARVRLDTKHVDGWVSAESIPGRATILSNLTYVLRTEAPRLELVEAANSSWTNTLMAVGH
jgi:antitoxin component HigA of HigAB toxin-antitoxin module